MFKYIGFNYLIFYVYIKWWTCPALPIVDVVVLLLEGTARVKTRTIAADFSHGVGIYDNIKKQLQGLDVGVLGKQCFKYQVWISHYVSIGKSVQKWIKMNFSGQIPWVSAIFKDLKVIFMVNVLNRLQNERGYWLFPLPSRSNDYDC